MTAAPLSATPNHAKCCKILNACRPTALNVIPQLEIIFKKNPDIIEVVYALSLIHISEPTRPY